jgi:hypothetical protein
MQLVDSKTEGSFDPKWRRFLDIYELGFRDRAKTIAVVS